MKREESDDQVNLPAIVDKLDPATIQTPEQGVQYIKLFKGAVAAARAIGLDRGKTNNYATKYVLSVWKTGQLLEPMMPGPGAYKTDEVLTSENFKRFCKDSDTSEKTAYRWHAVYASFPAEKLIAAELKKRREANAEYDRIITLGPFARPAARKRKPPRTLKHNNQIRAGDFRKVLADLEDDSLALILTDPPYSADSVTLYADLAKFAAAKLMKGGSLIAYSGQHNLPDVLRVFGESGLRYWWTIAVTHSAGSQRMPGKFVMIGWKPLVWFVKGARGDENFVRDTIRGDKPEKKTHEWAQGQNEASYLIEQLTQENEIVCDPFAGSGIFGKAALKLKRQFIGAELGNG